MLNNAFSHCPLILRLRLEHFETIALVAQCASEAQLPILELSMLTPDASIVLKKLKSETKKMVLGAGDILDLKMATQAYEAQVDFYSSPLARNDLWEYFRGHRVSFIPGAATPTEISFLRQKSFDLVYLEPLGEKAHKQLEDFSKLFVDIGFIPRVVLSIEQGQKYLQAGARAVAMELSTDHLKLIEGRDWIGLRESLKEWRVSISKAVISA